MALLPSLYRVLVLWFVFSDKFRTHGAGISGGIHAEELVTGDSSFPGFFLLQYEGLSRGNPGNFHRVTAGIYV